MVRYNEDGSEREDDEYYDSLFNDDELKPIKQTYSEYVTEQLNIERKMK
jgi:hypothetical protein